MGDPASALRILTIDDRACACAAVRDLSSLAEVRHAADLELALGALRDGPPDIVFIHGGLDPRGRPGAAVNAGAEISRRCGQSNLVLHGDRSAIGCVAALANKGIVARYLPEPMSEETLRALVGAVVRERRARSKLQAMSAASDSDQPSRLQGIGLFSFRERVEKSLIISALQQTGQVARAAASLQMEGRLGRRCRSLGISVGELAVPPRRSQRDRILVVGGLDARDAIGELADTPYGVAVLHPGKVHASGEWKAGAVAAIVHVSTVEAAVDAWALHRASPRIPLLLHGRPGPGVTQVLVALHLASEPLVSEPAMLGPFGTVLLEAGTAICDADLACASAGGMGTAGVDPAPVDLLTTLAYLEHLLCAQAVRERGAQPAAAKLLGISVPALHRRLRWSWLPD